MGRLSIIEKSLEEKLLQLNASSWHVGLLVGCVTEQRDYIVHFANTPIEKEDRPEKLSDLSDVLVTSHAGELLRMLPGGLCICGIAAIGSNLSSSNSKLQQLMTATYKTLCKSDKYGTQTNCWQLILVDSLSHKISSRSLLVDDYKNTLSPSEVRFQSLSSGWVIAETKLAVDRNFYICRKQENEHFEEQLLGGLSPYLQLISDSFCLCNGCVVSDDEQFGAESIKGKKFSHQNLSPTRVVVDLLGRAQTCSNSSCDEQMSSLRLKGTVSSIAFLRAPATAAQLSQAIKADLQRSLVTRCQLLCEDMLQVGSEKHSSDDQIVYETPPRVYITHTSLPAISFSDHMFKGEKVEDCTERAQQILGINSIDSATIDVTTERTADVEDLESLNRYQAEEVAADDSGATSRSSFLNNMPAIATLASGAVLAMVVSLTYLNLDEFIG
ncbi:protein odr-4 homolog [Watersipora subatra]|uniref:protein odr-4 homolog n=1 Tax=Watersipora subatra TaxID=2589382 RepID=UPI00355B4076